MKCCDLKLFCKVPKVTIIFFHSKIESSSPIRLKKYFNKNHVFVTKILRWIKAFIIIIMKNGNYIRMKTLWGKNIYEINMNGTFRRFKNLVFILFYYLCDLVCASNRHSKRSNQKKEKKNFWNLTFQEMFLAHTKLWIGQITLN